MDPTNELDILSIYPSLLDVSNDGQYSLYSQQTSATSITIPGPGSLAGKAIKALGQLTLRGLDRVMMYTRVRAALSRFPHDDTQAEKIKGIAKAYDIILELSRPGLYTPELRNTALLLIASQIEKGYTRQLVLALCRWHIVELDIFLRGMIQESVPLISYPSLDFYHSNSVPPLKVTPQQAVCLMSNVARTNKWACQTVVDIGFLDIFSRMGQENFSVSELVDIYHAIFYISTRPEYQQNEAGKKALSLLTLLITKPEPLFVNVLTDWKNWETKMLIENILHIIAPPRRLDFSDKQDPLVDAHFIQSLLGIWSRVADVNPASHLTHACYLDAIFFLQKRDALVQILYKELDISLAPTRAEYI